MWGSKYYDRLKGIYASADSMHARLKVPEADTSEISQDALEVAFGNRTQDILTFLFLCVCVVL